MPLRLQTFVISLSLLILIGIIALVQQRKLREEYSFLWLATGFGFLILAVAPNILSFVSRVIGTELPVNTLFFFGLVFVMLICLYYSLRISALTTQVKNLAQKLALLEAEKNSN